MIVERLGVRRPRVFRPPGRRPIGPVHYSHLDEAMPFYFLDKCGVVTEALRPPYVGNIVGATWVHDGLYFDEVDDYLTLDSVIAYLRSGLVVQDWSVLIEVSIPSGVHVGGNKGALLSLHDSAGNNRGPFLSCGRNASQYDNELSVFDGTSGIWEIDSNTIIADGTKHIVGFTREGSSAVAYVDGVSVGSYTSTFTMVASDQLVMGQEWDGGTPSDHLNGTISAVVFFNRGISADEAYRYSADIYQFGQSSRRPLIFSGAGGGVTLTIADVLHGHLVENLSLTQAHALAVQDASHGHTADNLDLVQLYTLTVQEASHAHAADNLDLTQAHALAVQEAGHAHAADSVVLETAGTLSVADALHGHTADNLDLTQAHLLAIADAAHAHAADNIDLSTGIPLVVADASHGHAADNVALTQAHVLAIAEAVHGHLADNIDLTVTHAVLIVSDALHAHLADNINLTIPGQSVDTPIGRIYLVQAENRVVAVAAENRTLIVQ